MENGSNDYHPEVSIHMIDHAYHMSVRSLSKAEVSDSGTIFDELSEHSSWAAEVHEIASDEECTSEVVEWNEDVERCQQDEWNGWADVLVSDTVPPNETDWGDCVENHDDNESSGGEWSVNVLQRNGEWNDMDGEESEKGDHVTGHDNEDMMEDDWNVEVLDTETDWNVDDAVDDPATDWGEETNSESAPPASDDWNVEVLEHVENDWSTDWNDEEDIRTFICELCQKRYLQKSSLTKHMFLVHNKRLNRSRDSYISEEEEW